MYPPGHSRVDCTHMSAASYHQFEAFWPYRRVGSSRNVDVNVNSGCLFPVVWEAEQDV